MKCGNISQLPVRVIRGTESQSDARVLPHGFKDWQAFLRVILLPNGFDRSELQPCLAPRLSRWHPRQNIRFALHREMLLNLFAQAKVAAPASRQIPHASQQPIQNCHARSSAFTSKKRARALRSRFAAVRVRPAHREHKLRQPRCEEWLLIEWPRDQAAPRKYWLSNLPASIPLRKLVALAKQRWIIERGYQELKQELGLICSGK